MREGAIAFLVLIQWKKRFAVRNSPAYVLAKKY